VRCKSAQEDEDEDKDISSTIRDAGRDVSDVVRSGCCYSIEVWWAIDGFKKMHRSTIKKSSHRRIRTLLCTLLRNRKCVTQLATRLMDEGTGQYRVTGRTKG